MYNYYTDSLNKYLPKNLNTHIGSYMYIFILREVIHCLLYGVRNFYEIYLFFKHFMKYAESIKYILCKRICRSKKKTRK